MKQDTCEECEKMIVSREDKLAFFEDDLCAACQKMKKEQTEKPFEDAFIF